MYQYKIPPRRRPLRHYQYKKIRHAGKPHGHFQFKVSPASLAGNNMNTKFTTQASLTIPPYREAAHALSVQICATGEPLRHYQYKRFATQASQTGIIQTNLSNKTRDLMS
jgi:hypothetical protein